MNIEPWILIAGNLLTPVILGVVGWLIRSSIDAFERRIAILEGDVKGIQEILANQKAHEERLNRVREDLSAFMNNQIASHNEWRLWVRTRFEALAEQRAIRMNEENKLFSDLHTRLTIVEREAIEDRSLLNQRHS